MRWLCRDELFSGIAVPLAVLRGHLGVHCVWSQIDITGPCNRAGVDIDASKEIRVAQWPKRARQIFAV